MIVRELIASLLDYDMDATVEIIVESKEDSFDTNDFELEENGTKLNSYLTFKVVPDGHIVVDESDYKNLEIEVKELEDTVERMSSFVEEMEQK
ncbi:hypothetical protein [Psychrobacillus sp. BM2]|uniref:hypothetical protein n=1 Tax=Psychrobacillus sp. BM2 TaxID=3400421 RepID=UPI003B01D77E